MNDMRARMRTRCGGARSRSWRPAQRRQPGRRLRLQRRDLVLTGAGRVGDQPFGELALASYEEAGDLLMMSRCLINLAIRALQEGRWPLAQERLERASELMRRVGDTANEALAAYNRADLAIRQGRFERPRTSCRGGALLPRR